MAREIYIEIDDEGNVTVEGKGFKGPECEMFTKELEHALGTIEKKTYKPEYKAAPPLMRKAGA